MTAGRGRYYVVALEARSVVGYGGLINYGDEAHITTIAVEPKLHRRKIGTRLLYELVSEAVRMRSRAVSLEVRVTNWGAQRLYARFGFRPVGVRKNYYQETSEDAVVMWTDDIHSPEYGRLLEQIMAGAPRGLTPS
jgi:ribosomal-protein-alanine N-acetyltransferase